MFVGFAGIIVRKIHCYKNQNIYAIVKTLFNQLHTFRWVTLCLLMILKLSLILFKQL